MKRWCEFIAENYQKMNLIEQVDGEIEFELNIYTGENTETEIKDAIKKLKTGKAAGEDNILTELLKTDFQTSTNILYKLINQIWSSEKVPQDWATGILIKLPKKGDQTQCCNWRGITLLSTVSKILSRIMLERMKSKLDKILRENQAGLRANRSCSEQITTLRIIIEQLEEFNAPLLSCFINFG